MQATAIEPILSFLREIGITVEERTLPETTFLPGLELGPACIYMDPERLAYPGDLLHEAGHLAVTTPAQRERIGTAALETPWPTEGEEIAAVLWSYAAATHIGLPIEVVFHENGYKNEAAWLREQFTNRNYMGLPLLEWMGLSYGEERAATAGIAPFPHMVNWIRN